MATLETLTPDVNVQSFLNRPIYIKKTNQKTKSACVVCLENLGAFLICLGSFFSMIGFLVPVIPLAYFGIALSFLGLFLCIVALFSSLVCCCLSRYK